MAEYSDYNTYANQEEGYYGQGYYPVQRYGGFSQDPYSTQKYGYTTSRPYQRDISSSYSSSEGYLHHSRSSLDLKSTHNDFNSDYNDELPPRVTKSEKFDPQGLDVDQGREDQKDARKWRDRREKERRDAEEQELRNRYCLLPGCEFRTQRRFDLERHMKKHYPTRPDQLLDCPGRGCDRVGEHGFTRKDHLTEHLKKVHRKKTGS